MNFPQQISENEEYYESLDTLLQYMFPEMNERLREKNLDFSRELEDFDQKNHISKIQDFLEKRGYKLYGTKLLNKPLQDMLSDEEKKEIETSRILLGFKKLEADGDVYFVLVYPKDGSIKKLIKKFSEKFGKWLQGEFA